jgi:hypothetical protein
MSSFSSASDCFQGGNRKDNILQWLQCDYTNHRNKENELGKIPEQMVFHEQTANPFNLGKMVQFHMFFNLIMHYSRTIVLYRRLLQKIHHQNRYIFDTNAILTFLDFGNMSKHDKCKPIYVHSYLLFNTVGIVKFIYFRHIDSSGPAQYLGSEWGVNVYMFVQTVAEIINVYLRASPTFSRLLRKINFSRIHECARKT